MGRVRILGLSCDYHDAAAALVVDGEVAAAAEAERFSRVKHDNSFPTAAIESCLTTAGVDVTSIDAVIFHEKPLLVASRVLAARQRRGPAGLGRFTREFPTLVRRNLMIANRVETELRRLGAVDPQRLLFSEHHLSHAAAAFYPSPFPTAAILTVDGIGEWSTATIGHGLHHRLYLLEEQRFPHSLGLLYSLATAWCGFEPNDGEYKLMGLAPFGEPRFAEELATIARVGEDGALEISDRAVKWWGADPRRMRKLVQMFDGPPRSPGEPLTQREADLARSVQDLTEATVLAMARHAHTITGEANLCLAGGVALNCVANARLQREGAFDHVWVQPAAGDAGSAIGAALWLWHEEMGNERATPKTPDGMGAAALGPSFDSDEVAEQLADLGVTSRRLPDVGERCGEVATRLADGAIVGWFEGRMEFGPRALGRRSILADPRSPTVQRDLNQRVKNRESFRPFAPAVLWEHASEWFDLDQPSPYMLFTYPVAEARLHAIDDEPHDFVGRVQVVRSDIPACTHIDGSSRVQTVHAETSPVFHRLLSEFHTLTGCPVLLNTSFNRAGDPIVCTPEDAVATFRAAGLDLLVIEDHLVEIDR